MSGLPQKRALRNLVWLLLLAFASTSCAGGGADAVECDRDGAAIEDGLEVRDIVCGSGPVAGDGSTLTVRYQTSLADGTVVDRPAGEGSYTFRLGAGQVVEGWDAGLLGMAEGGTRELLIPPQLAYGDAGLHPDIPPGATVTFEVDLVEVLSPET